MTTTTYRNENAPETILSNLSILRNAIETYRTQHDHFPGRTGAEEFVNQLTRTTDAAGNTGNDTGNTYGPYIHETTLPENPITGTCNVRVVKTMPTEPIGTEAWIYDNCTGEIRANAIGITDDGKRYFDF